MIDTLMYVKRLEAIGVSREHAEIQVQVMADIVDNNYATKQDAKDIRNEIVSLSTEFKHDMAELRHEMRALGDKLTIKLGSIVIVGMSALATILKFF